MTGNLLSADQVAARLGVKVQSVYAYVSRGLLTRTLADDGRTSRFDPVEVEHLARRGRPRPHRRAGAVDVLLATSVTAIREGRLRYRGHDVTDLVTTQTFESVAELLWSGRLAPAPEWRGRAAGHRAARWSRRCCPATGPWPSGSRRSPPSWRAPSPCGSTCAPRRWPNTPAASCASSSNRSPGAATRWRYRPGAGGSWPGTSGPGSRRSVPPGPASGCSTRR